MSDGNCGNRKGSQLLARRRGEISGEPSSTRRHGLQGEGTRGRGF